MHEKMFKAVSKDSGKTYRCMAENSDTIFVFAQRSRKYGRRMSKQKFAETFTRIEQPDEAAQWSKRVAKTISKLEKSGLWHDLLDDFHTLARIEYDDLKAMRAEAMSEWKKRIKDKNHRTVSAYQMKYPDAYATVNGSVVLKPFFQSDLSDCKLKSMYFGKMLNRCIKEDIAESLRNKRKYSINRINAGYDVSYSYEPKQGRAWYSEEYRGLGNGHYYLAIDENTALFSEND